MLRFSLGRSWFQVSFFVLYLKMTLVNINCVHILFFYFSGFFLSLFIREDKSKNKNKVLGTGQK